MPTKKTLPLRTGAIAHSLSTVAGGGFSTHDDSIGFFNSGFVEESFNDETVIWLKPGMREYGLGWFSRNKARKDR